MSIYPEFNITRTTAAPSKGVDESVIPAGKSKMRLVFGDDPRFHILAKTIKPLDANHYKPGDYVEKGFWTKKKYVVFALEGKVKQNVLVSIVSLSRRLHLEEGTIMTAAFHGKLGELIRTNISKLQKEEKVRESLENELKQKIDKPELVKAIALRILKGEMVGFGLGKDRFIAKVVHEKLKLEKIGAELGKGHCGKVYEIGEGTDEVVKRPKQIDKAPETLQNEYEILKGALPSNKTVLGIQPSIHRVVVLNSENNQVAGYWNVTKRLKMDYTDYINNTKDRNKIEDILREIHQLLFALNFLEENNILHGDIKPPNIMADGLGNLRLIDFGGSRRVTADSLSIFPKSHTRAFTSGLEWNEADGLQFNITYAAEKGDFDKVKKLKEELIFLVKKMDVLSMGIVLFNAVTKMDPYNFYEDGFLNFSIPGTSLRANADFDIPYALERLILRMIGPNFKKRPCAREAFDEFKRILDDYPKLKVELAAKEWAQ